MTQRFDELAAQRDPLYAATSHRHDFEMRCNVTTKLSINGQLAKTHAYRLSECDDQCALGLAIRALRNETL